MDIAKDLYNKLDYLVKKILVIGETNFLVGSSIEYLLKGEIPKDYDILIENRQDFMSVCRMVDLLIESDEGFKMEINTLGGIKLIHENGTIDFWCQSLGEFILKANSLQYIYHLNSARVLKIQ